MHKNNFCQFLKQSVVSIHQNNTGATERQKHSKHLECSGKISKSCLNCSGSGHVHPGGALGLHPCQQFFSIVGTEHLLLCTTSTFWKVNSSCSRKQHGDPSEERTPDPRQCCNQVQQGYPDLMKWGLKPGQ